MKSAPLLVLLGLAATGYVGSGLKDQVELPPTPVGLDAHETNAGASVLGQFRTTATGWLWLRTDLYLHNGVEMRMLSDQELAGGAKGVGSRDEELGRLLNDDKVVTLVPDEARDFRGIFGDIERATQTYQSMKKHGHNEPKDALPLFRLMTWVDPQFVPGWTTAASIIADDRKDGSFNQAVGLLTDGLHENPKSVQILNELGRLYASRPKDYENALVYLDRAVELNLDPKKLEEGDAEAYLNVFRWASLCYRELGNREGQHRTAALGLRAFPDDTVLGRLAGEAPYFLSEEGQRKWLRDRVVESTPKSNFDPHDHDHDGHPDHSPEGHGDDDHDHHDHE